MTNMELVGNKTASWVLQITGRMEDPFLNVCLSFHY